MSGEPSFDPDDRQLCDDGACLGVVVGGKCNVCGVASVTGGPRDSGSGGNGGTGGGTGGGDSGSGDAATRGPRDPGSGGTGSGVALAAADHDSFDPDRQLCSDGACTGLLGSDGKCKECGRSAAS